jgi:hypothetical protein
MNKNDIKILSRYSTDSLYAEINRRQEKENIKNIKSLNINGITVKDFVVRFCQNDDGEYEYSFYILKGKVEYCIYYGFENQDWWPQYEKNNDASKFFIPSKFSESMENVYQTNLIHKEAIKYLRQNGFTKIKQGFE